MGRPVFTCSCPDSLKIDLSDRLNLPLVVPDWVPIFMRIALFGIR